MATAAQSNVKHISRFVGGKYRVNPKGTRGMDFSEVLANFTRSRTVGTGNSKGPARPRTIFEYEYDIKKFTQFLKDKGHTCWNDFTKEDVDAYVDTVQARDLKPNSKFKVLRSLRTFLRWVSVDTECARQGMAPHLESIPVIPQSDRRVWVPTTEQVMKFHNAMSGPLMWDFRDYCITSLLIDCGPRIGEVCLLTLDNLKLDAGQLVIPQGGKTGTRIVPIDKDVTVPLLKRWLEVRARYATKGQEWLFCNKYGGYLMVFTIEKAFNKHRAAAGITDPLSPHTLRHYFATHYLVNGGSLQNLKMILGHESYDTLQIYVHMAQQMSHVQEEHSRVSPLKSMKNAAVPPKKKRRTS